jgi:hypothetical protein
MSDSPAHEPRWAKMVEIRPTNMKGRRIVHHSIAYLVLNNDPTPSTPARPTAACATSSIW